jgi:hypothetical protein
MSGDIDGIWDHIKENIQDYMKEVFIKICGEYLENESDKNQLPFTVEEIGNWWVNDDEAGTTDGFDLVSLGKCENKAATIFAQCYYNNEPIEVAQLKSQNFTTAALQQAVAPILGQLAGIQNQVDDIKNKMPNTVPVQYPNLQVVNSTPYMGGFYGNGFGGNVIF